MGSDPWEGLPATPPAGLQPLPKGLQSTWGPMALLTRWGLGGRTSPQERVRAGAMFRALCPGPQRPALNQQLRPLRKAPGDFARGGGPHATAGD